MKDEIDLFVHTGEYDPLFHAWSGQDFFERATLGSEALTDALLTEVRRRESSISVNHAVSIPDGDTVAFTRNKVEPMVRGLFPARERDTVLAILEQSLVFLTPASIGPLVRGASFLHTAWQLANIYLGSIGAEPLGEDMRGIVGLSEETTCYVSPEYFAEEDPFADFVVHEAAHVFHNTKRQTVGLSETRRREWLLDIDFSKRETFAYCCEAYSRILELSTCPAERKTLLEELEEYPPPSDDRVEPDEYFNVLAEAVARRNGWKAILERCSPRPVS